MAFKVASQVPLLLAAGLAVLQCIRAQNSCDGNCRSTLTEHTHLQGTIIATYINVPHMTDCCKMCQQNAGCAGFNYCPSGSSNGGGCLPFQAGNGRSGDGGACELVGWTGNPTYTENSAVYRPTGSPTEILWESAVKACNLPEPPPTPPSGFWAGLTPAQYAQGGRKKLLMQSE
eukprot:jgi/Botrbrau1/10212/Bobra.0362s0002.1